MRSLWPRKFSRVAKHHHKRIIDQVNASTSFHGVLKWTDNIPLCMHANTDMFEV